MEETSAAPAASSSRPSIREASFADYERIAALQRKYKLVVENYSDWTHLWLENPIFDRVKRSWPIGWVLECDDEIVGHFGNIPLEYEFCGESIIAASGRAWVVDSPYRGYAVALLDEFLGQANVTLFLNTSANEEAYKAFLAFGAARVPVGHWDRSATWVCRYRDFARRWLNQRHLPFVGATQYPIAAALWAFARPRHAVGSRQPGLEVDICSDFDQRFDEFWQKLRKKHERGLIAVRSREALQWHFKKALESGNAWIVTVSRGTRMEAYAIVLERENIPGMRVALLADLQTLSRDPESPAEIVAHILRECRQRSIAALIDVGLCVGNGVGRHAPFKRARVWSYLYEARPSELRKALEDPCVWAPSMFDGDATL